MAIDTLSERLTYEAWLKLPETKQPHEVIDGVMRMAPAPVWEHQWIVQNIESALVPFVRSRHLGVVLSSPVDVVIKREPLRTRQPDLMFLSTERTGIRGRKELAQAEAASLAPDLCVEVLSPSNTRLAMDEKLEDYRTAGVLECWLVSPEAETVEILALSPEQITRTGLYGSGDSVISAVLPDLPLTVDEVFA
jgi:Uma2 family endonuclease